MKKHKQFVALAFLSIFLNHSYANEISPLPIRNLDSATSRVFIYRTDAPVGFVGVHVNVKGKRFATLSKEEFDVVHFPSGELPIEVAQGGFSLEVCRAKVTIDPLKNNYLKIKDRDGAFAKSLFFGGLLVQALDKADCNGVNEILKVTEAEAIREMKGLKFTPLRNPVDLEMTEERICKFATQGRNQSCEVSLDVITQYSPINYIQLPQTIQVNQPPVQQNQTSSLIIICKVADNPPIQLDAASCLNVKGEIVGGESLTCTLGSNPPIKLSPELCVKGGGVIAR